MKIALIRQRYTPFGGAERFVARAMEALGNQGAQLTIITRQWQTDGTTPALICNPFYLGNVWRDWSFARCVCQTLAKQQFDLVQSHERIACCDVYRAGDGVHREWLTQHSRVLGPLGRLGIALNPYHHYAKQAEKRLFEAPRLKAVICNSRMVRDEILGYFNIAPSKLHVIYSGVDTEAFHPRLKTQHREPVRCQFGIPSDSPLFLFVGSGFQRKGLMAAMQALAHVSSAHLMVVGTDKKMRQYRQTANRLGISGRIHFTGGQQDVAPFYGAADAFVLPTLYDPFPNAAMEAMACGLPIITSTKSGAAEMIENGLNGFVHDALDYAAITHSMTLFSQPGKAEVMGSRARATIEPCTLDKMSAALSALYQQLLAQRNMI